MGKLERYLKNMRGNVFRMMCEDYENLAIQRYKWKNLPEPLESEKLEQMLYDNPQVVTFKNKTTLNDVITNVDSPLLFIPISGEYNWNVYDIPQNLTAEKRGLFAQLKIDECVIIKNNFMRTTTRERVEYWVEKMCNIQSAMDLNVNATKTPFVLSCDNEKEKLTLLNFYESIGCSKPLIITDSNSKLNYTEKKVLTTGVLPIMDQYQQAYLDCKNELLTYLGIDNVSIEKRERLLTGEIEQNDELINDNLYRGYLERKKACEKINKMFGTNIDVEIQRFAVDKNNEQGDDENATKQLHNNDTRNDGSRDSDIQ